MTQAGEQKSTVDGLTSVDAKILNMRLDTMQTEMNRIGEAAVEISQSLQVLSRLEQGHQGILDRLKDGAERFKSHESRLQTIEVHMPALIELRKWVIGGILAGLGMVGVAIFKLVLVDQQVVSQREMMLISAAVERATRQALESARQQGPVK